MANTQYGNRTALLIIAALVFLSFACMCYADNRMSVTQLSWVPGATVQATKPSGNMVAAVHGNVYYTGVGSATDVLVFPKATGGSFTLNDNRATGSQAAWAWVGMMAEGASGFTWVYKINSQAASSIASANALCAFNESGTYGVYVVGAVKGSPVWFFNRNVTAGLGTAATRVAYILRVLETGVSQLIMQAYSTGATYGNGFTSCLSVPGTSAVLVGGYFVRAISFNGTSIDTGGSTSYNTPIVIRASNAGKATWNKYWASAGGTVEALATDGTYFYAAGYYKQLMSTLTDCTSYSGNCGFLFQLSAAGAETSILGGCYATAAGGAAQFYGMTYYNNVLYLSGQSAGAVSCTGGVTSFTTYTQFLLSTATSSFSLAKILSNPADSNAAAGLLSSLAVDTTNSLLYYAFSFASTFDGCGTTFFHDGTPLDTGINFAVAMYDISSTISSATSCKAIVVEGTPTPSTAQDKSPSLALSSTTTAGVDTLFLTTYCDTTVGSKFWKLTGYLCGNNGTCMSDGTCVCTYGYGGARCGTKCPTKNGNICNNQGYCNSVSTATPSCTCNFGYNGTACDVTICNGRGAKQGSTCLCAANWTGTACELPCTGYMSP